MSIRALIAQAVVDEINAGVAASPSPFGGLTFTAVRAHVPLYDLTDLKVLHVTVIARSYDEEPISRTDTAIDLEIDIGVQEKLDAAGALSAATIDPLADLVEHILIYMRNRPLAGYASARWRGQKNPQPYLPEHLAEKRLFTSVITLTYRVMV